MSPQYYLSLCYDALAKSILKAIITKNCPNESYRDLNEHEFKKIEDKEYW